MRQLTKIAAQGNDLISKVSLTKAHMLLASGGQNERKLSSTHGNNLKSFKCHESACAQQFEIEGGRKVVSSRSSLIAVLVIIHKRKR